MGALRPVSQSSPRFCGNVVSSEILQAVTECCDIQFYLDCNFHLTLHITIKSYTPFAFPTHLVGCFADRFVDNSKRYLLSRCVDCA